MLKKSIRQNFPVFAIGFISIVFFSHILFLGGKRLYRMEANWRHGVATARLLYGKEIIKSELSDYAAHLVFLAEFSKVRKLLSGDTNRIDLKQDVIEFLEQHANVFEEFDTVEIIDTQGLAVASIGNITQTNNGFSFNENKKHKGKIDGAKGSHTLYFEKSLSRDDGFVVGKVQARLGLSTIFKLLPENVFIQDDNDFLIKEADDGSILFTKSPYNISNSPGMLRLSRTETIHHEPIEIIPGRTFILAMLHRHSNLAGTLNNLLLLSAALLSVFITLVTFVSVVILRKFSERVRTQKAIIASLVEMTDWRDPETGGHLIRTQTYSTELARQLRKTPKYRKIITEEFIENLYDAAPLHDIGKVGIPDAILLKPGKLTTDEFTEMKKHTRIGGALLQDMINDFGLKEPFIIMAKNITFAHHEKFNGTGYPLGLSGDNIPIEARIFAVADVYDALRSERPYKDVIPHMDSIAIIHKDTGTHFDPDIIDALDTIETRFKEISESK